MAAYDGFGGVQAGVQIRNTKKLPNWRPPAGVPDNDASDSGNSSASSDPGGGGDGGGGGLGSNPYYNQLESMYRAQGTAEAASMRSSIQQMLIGMGLVPEGFKDKFGALDATTKALIDKNTTSGISTLARLNEQKGMGIKDLVNRLNARGLRRSGARGSGLRKNQLGYDRNLADSLQGLLGQVGNMYGAYTQNEYARQAALINAAMQMYAYASNNGSGVGGNGGNNNSGNSGSGAGMAPSGSYTGLEGTVPTYQFGSWTAF